MNTIFFIAMFIVIVCSILSFILRKPGPKGDKGDTGYVNENVIVKKVLFALSECEELNFSNTVIKAKDFKKTKKGTN